jgi:drug/metabolite transporter (DMT)-like permease
MYHQKVKGCFYAVFSAVIYGSMPLMAKYVYADGVTPLTLVFLRNLFSIVPLAILAYREKKTLKIPVSTLPSIGLMSLLGCCLTPVFLFSSYQYIPSGLATVFNFAYPSFVVMGEILFLRKKVHASSIVSVLLCAVGISMFYTPQEAFNLTGSALALTSAMTFAGYVLLLSRFDSGKVSGFLFSLYITSISSVMTLGLCLVTDNLVFPATMTGWGLCILLSILVTTIAVVLFQQSVFLIGGEATSILSTLEPIVGVAIGVVVFGEAFGIRTFLGTILVILASVITVFFHILKKSKQA